MSVQTRRTVTRLVSQSALSAVLLLSLGACDDDSSDLETKQEFLACDTEVPLADANPNYPWTANAITLVSEKMSDGVFAVYDERAAQLEPMGIPLATSGGFVIGDDGVLIVETMLNRRLFCQVIDLVKAETDKPILYAVNTSHHGDHSYGNAFLPEDVQIVQHRETVDFIGNAMAFAGDKAFMEGAFGADQGIDEITATAADIVVPDTGWSVDLGGKNVTVDFHGFAQTGGDVFIHAVEADVLWVGNAVVAASPAIPWLLDGHAVEVHATLETVAQTLTDTTIVIYGHGAPVRGTNSLTFSVDYLTALIDGVRTGVMANSTIDEVVGELEISMASFQGYALWGWVHQSINVPNTFAELQL